MKLKIRRFKRPLPTVKAENKHKGYGILKYMVCGKCSGKVLYDRENSNFKCLKCGRIVKLKEES